MKSFQMGVKLINEKHQVADLKLVEEKRYRYKDSKGNDNAENTLLRGCRPSLLNEVRKNKRNKRKTLSETFRHPA